MLYGLDEEYRKLVDQLIALSNKIKIATPVDPSGRTKFGNWWNVPCLNEEETRVLQETKNVLTKEELDQLKKEYRDLIAKINKRANELQNSRGLRFIEGALWGGVKTFNGVGEAIANPTKVVEGLHKLATDENARKLLLEMIEKKLNDGSAENVGELAVDITSLVAGAGAGVKITITLSKSTVKGVKEIIDAGRQLTTKELDDIIKANTPPPISGTHTIPYNPNIVPGKGIDPLTGKKFPSLENLPLLCPKQAPKVVVDPRKFTDYVFKEGDPTGKGAAFRQLGYDKQHSAELVKLWEKMAAEKYAKGDYKLGKKDQYGQRIDIEIELPGIAGAAGETSYMKSGWMIQPDGSITLNTPFSGYTR